MSKDGTPAIIKEYEEKHSFIHLLVNEKKSTPFALNLGLKKSDAELKIILGAHAEIDQEYIIENLNALSVSKEIGCTGGIIENVYEDQISEVIGNAMSSRFGVGNAHFRTSTKEGYVDTVAFGAYRKEVFERVGYFDEELVRNQDDEFNYRLLKAGFSIYLSKKIRSKYYVRASFSKLYRQYFQYGYWKVFVNKKHGSITTARQVVPLLFVLYLFLGLGLSIIFPPIGVLYLLGILVYLILALLSAFRLQSSFTKGIKTAWVFFLLHYSYGLGYLQGIFQFIVLGKGPQSKQTISSR